MAVSGPRNRQRADLLFAVLVQLGPEGSLELLHLHLRTMGISVSLSTLKRYSSQFAWQERLAEHAAKAANATNDRSLKSALAVHERHVQIARAVQGAGGKALQELLQDDARLEAMRPVDIARLIELGLKAERDALGHSRNRRDAALSLANLITERVVDLFTRVNEGAEPLARARAFALGLDAIIDAYLSAEEDTSA